MHLCDNFRQGLLVKFYFMKDFNFLTHELKQREVLVWDLLSCKTYRMATNLENLENSGNSKNCQNLREDKGNSKNCQTLRENSGNSKNCQNLRENSGKFEFLQKKAGKMKNM